MNKSINRKIFSDIIVLPIMIIVISVILICIVFCANYRNEQMGRNSMYVSEYAQRIRNEMKLAEEKSSSILKYSYILNNLNRDYKDTYDRLEVTMNIASYLESIMGDNVTIYISSEGAFPSKYIRPISDLQNTNKLYYKIRSSVVNCFWGEKVYNDSNGDYFLLYREMKMNENSILVCKVYIPKLYAEDNSYSIIQKSEIKKFEIVKEISSGYYAASNLLYHNVYTMWIIYILLFSLLGGIFIIVFVIFTKTNIRKTTFDIDSFVSMLKKEDIFSSDFEFEMNENESTELAVIKKTISSLVKHVREISYIKYEADLEKKKLEMNLLLNRIDPHMLYNSLTVIKMNATRVKDSKTVWIVDNLVSYYRAALNNGKEYVSIAREIEMLRRYVNINEISNGKSYEFKTEIQKGLEEKQILHMMLQPFLENSLVHGLGGRRENCYVEIKCSYDCGFLIFEINDNGYGMDEKTRQMLSNLEDYSQSYGIKNVFSRIKLEYGEKSEIIFKSVKDEFTNVVLKIPFEM